MSARLSGKTRQKRLGEPGVFCGGLIGARDRYIGAILQNQHQLAIVAPRLADHHVPLHEIYSCSNVTEDVLDNIVPLSQGYIVWSQI